MKNKNEIAVKITDKNREKVKAILEMFGERVSSNTSLSFDYLVFSRGYWCGHGSLKLGDVTLTEVKPKELKQILAREKLREGDYIKTTYGDIKKCDVFWFDTLSFKRYATKEEIEEFEGKKELQVGKWYKNDSGSLCLVESIDESGNVYGYEIDTFGVWLNYTNQDGAICLLNSIAKKSVKEATPQEVETALIKEAKKRGFRYGSYVFDIKENELLIKDIEDGWWYLIFRDGKWDEVIKNDDKFVELKEAHKKGAVIQYKSLFKPFEWIDVSNNKPSWNSSYEYRVKPDDKPKVGDVVKAWDRSEDNFAIGVLLAVKNSSLPYNVSNLGWFYNAKVLTPKEVIGLLFKK